ncbi:MAG: hypothetical protein ACR2GE_10060 [Pseudonocardia sp.]
MAEPITDQHIVGVLRPFVRAARPVLDALRESDPFGLRARVRADLEGSEDDDERGLRERVLDQLASVQVPGTAAWAAMDVDQRTHWWIHRVGRFTTLLAAVPGIGGVLADRLPVQAALGAAGQGLLLTAIAGEHGVRDEDELVALLGSVLFKRDLRAANGGVPDGASEAEVAAKAEQLSGELTGERKPALRKIGGAVWRLGRTLYALGDELDKRPHGRFYHQALGMLPVVGMVGDYFGERSGLKRAAKAALKWLRQNPPAGTARGGG